MVRTHRKFIGVIELLTIIVLITLVMVIALDTYGKYLNYNIIYI